MSVRGCVFCVFIRLLVCVCVCVRACARATLPFLVGRTNRYRRTRVRRRERTGKQSKGKANEYEEARMAINDESKRERDVCTIGSMSLIAVSRARRNPPRSCSLPSRSPSLFLSPSRKDAGKPSRAPGGAPHRRRSRPRGGRRPLSDGWVISADPPALGTAAAPARDSLPLAVGLSCG